MRYYILLPKGTVLPEWKESAVWKALRDLKLTYFRTSDTPVNSPRYDTYGLTSSGNLIKQEGSPS